MDEQKYEVGMQIIMHGGNAKSLALMAIDAAAANDYEKAAMLMKEAQDEIAAAHSLQFSMIQREASGEHVEVNIILVHAQDHLSMALVTVDLAQRLIAFSKQLCRLNLAKPLLGLNEEKGCM